MKTYIPDFSIVLITDNKVTSSPGPKLELLRHATGTHISKALKQMYPMIHGLDVAFAKTREIESRIIIDVHVAVTFSNTTAMMHKTKLAAILETILTSLDQTYLSIVVQPLIKSVIDIQTSKLGTTSGGKVKAIPFYAAFVCSNEPTKSLTAKEMKKFLQLTINEAIKQVKNVYGSYFEELSMRITRTAIGSTAADVSDTKFNLYVEFEASGTFKANAPTRNDFYSTIVSKILPNQNYIKNVVDIGGPFASLTFMVMRPCEKKITSIETVDKESNSMTLQEPQILPDESKEEKKADATIEVPKPILPRKPVSNGDGTVSVFSVDIRNSFMISSVEPSDSDYQALVGATRDFYQDHLKKTYKYQFLDIKVSTLHIHWSNNIPRVGYNLCIDWNVEAKFLDCDEAPDSWTLTNTLVMAGLNRYLKKYVIALEDTPFARTSGIHMEHTKSIQASSKK